jgi:hypothetical protein
VYERIQAGRPQRAAQDHHLFRNEGFIQCEILAIASETRGTGRKPVPNQPKIFALKGGGYGCLFSLAGIDEERLTDRLTR